MTNHILTTILSRADFEDQRFSSEETMIEYSIKSIDKLNPLLSAICRTLYFYRGK